MRRDFRGQTAGKEAEIVEGDLAEIDCCDAVLAAFMSPDEGTAMEAWYAHGLGKPVVAAINGAALGGGFEITLACHHRIVVDDSKAVVGFPEVQLGLLPGAGGVVRSVRLLGIAEALLNVLLQGQQLRPEKALKTGLLHELVDTPEELLAKAKEWIKANPEAAQPWDTPGHKIPGGTPSSPKFAANLPAFPANLRKQLKGAPMPAPRNIMAAAVEGSQVDFDTALDIEGRYFVELVCGQTAKNMSKAFFFDLQMPNAQFFPAFVVLVVASVSFIGIGMMMSVLPLISPEKGTQLGFVAQGTLLVVSGVYYPVSVLPEWMQALATISPATYALDGMRDAIVNGEGLSMMWDEIWPLIVIGIVSVPLGLEVFRRGERYAKKHGKLKRSG